MLVALGNAGLTFALLACVAGVVMARRGQRRDDAALSASVRPIAWLSVMGVGIAVVVSMVACIVSAVVAPIAAVTSRVAAGASSAPDVESWESSSAAPVYDAMSQLAPPPSVRLFGDE